MKRECETCIKNKTMYCPNSTECMTTDDKPYYQNKIMLLEENKQLKLINREYERLNKERGKGFKIINVQEYNVDELLSYKNYKDNWNKLKRWLYEDHCLYVREVARNSTYQKVLEKMEEIEKGEK